MDARRTLSLIRDERRLQAAVAEHEKRRFDVDTALTVKYRVEDLLETVGIIVQDQDFWDRLADISRPPSSQQLERVRRLDPLAFAAILEAAGYASPPPPPVEELVDDTIAALIVAVTSPAHGNVDQVGGARWQLQTLVMRVRRQINEQVVPELAPSILRSSARSLGRAARWLIPRVAGATAGALVEAHAPGSGLGLIAWHSAERTADDLGELTTQMVLGDPSPAPGMVTADEPAWTEIDPLSVHIAALSDQASWFGAFTLSAEQLRQMVHEGRRHLDRIEELVHDGSRETMGVTEHIRAISKELDALSRSISPADRLSVEVAARAEVARLREKLTQEAEPHREEPTQEMSAEEFSKAMAFLRDHPQPGPSAPRPPPMPA
jgi:hypothetical protein